MSENANVTNETEEISTPKRQKMERESPSKYLVEFDGKKCKHCGFVSQTTGSQKMRASNAQRHLERIHKHIADTIAAEIKGKKESNLGLRRTFAIYAATTTFPLQHIENELLQKAINGNNEKNQIPYTIRTLKNDILKELHLIKSKIKDLLSKSLFISLSTDIATTKGMRYSYLGVVAHIWDGFKSHNLGLEHVELHESHKSVYIRNVIDNIIREYNISPEKIVRIVTDSAANMKAAFVQPFTPFSENEDEFEDWNVMEIATKNDMNQLQELYSGNNCSPDMESKPEININGHIHISCAAHRLQLVLKDVFENNLEAIQIRQVVFSLLNKFSKSHNATKELHQLSGKKILFPANTRWSSLQITYSRLLEIMPSVNTVH